MIMVRMMTTIMTMLEIMVIMMTTKMPMMIIFMYPTTAASILSGFIPSGSRLVDPSAEELSVSVSEIMNLINVMIYN